MTLGCGHRSVIIGAAQQNCECFQSRFPLAFSYGTCCFKSVTYSDTTPPHFYCGYLNVRCGSFRMLDRSLKTGVILPLCVARRGSFLL